MFAAKYGHTAIVDLLLAAGAYVNFKEESNKRTALTMASRWGRTAVVDLLLAAGADVNAKDRWDAIPLFYAAAYGHVEIVRLLLNAGSDVNAQEVYRGETPLMVAEREGHTDVVRAIERFLTEQVRTLWIYRHRARQRDRLGLSELERGTHRLGLRQLNRGSPLMDRLVYYIQGFL
jgi:ankyrin repeat protein